MLSENQVCVRASKETNVHTLAHASRYLHDYNIVRSVEDKIGFQQCIGLRAEDQHNKDYLCNPQGRLMAIPCNVKLLNTLTNIFIN